MKRAGKPCSLFPSNFKRMKSYFLLGFLCLALLAHGQQESGLKFENFRNWQSVLQKATQEHKTIFVDCYATWCAPCKAMERSVFGKKEVGDFVNQNFISVKLQIDTSKNDADDVKSWYPESSRMKNDYGIVAVPTFLFFSSDGKAIHKSIGYKNDDAFLSLCRSALTPDSQYYTRLRQVKDHQATKASIMSLLTYASNIDDNSNANLVAGEYLHDYLDKLRENDFANMGDINFVIKYHKLLSSKDVIFQTIFKKPHLIDSIAGFKVANSLVEGVVQQEEIKPYLDQSTLGTNSPDWIGIYNRVKTKYGVNIANSAIIAAKVFWFQKTKNWPLFTKNLVLKVKQYLGSGPEPGLGKQVFLNNSAWQIFLHSKNNEELLEAVKWADIVITAEKAPSAGFIDTKANLLYKAGKRRLGIYWEKRALAISKNDAGIAATLSKMQNKRSTWNSAN